MNMKKAITASSISRESKSETPDMVITGVGYELPSHELDNHYFARFMETSDEWIKSRTGISKRYYALPILGETTNSLAAKAALRACAMAGLDAAKDLDFIICGTLTPDEGMPTMACSVQKALGMKRGFAFDLSAACAGFVFGLTTAEKFLRSGSHRRGLVIGAESLSSIVNPLDRSTCVLFGDGAGAVVVEARSNPSGTPYYCGQIESDGNFADLLCLPAGDSKINTRDPRYSETLASVHMKGHELFKVAVRYMRKVVEQCLEEAGISGEQVDLFIPHQANIRIIDKLAEELNFPKDKIYVNIDRVGNTSAASIPIGCGMALAEGRLKGHETLLASSFGGGLNYGACLFTLRLGSGAR
jgi:3-oxoacyl-[acyl-carrier-protein] synthase-3